MDPLLLPSAIELSFPGCGCARSSALDQELSVDRSTALAPSSPAGLLRWAFTAAAFRRCWLVGLSLFSFAFV